MSLPQPYTCWTHGDRWQGVSFVRGLSSPQFADGTLIHEVNVLEYVIYAASWEEAMARHHEFQGWEPYKPMGGCGQEPVSGSDS